jgi:hypothetical protein
MLELLHLHLAIFRCETIKQHSDCEVVDQFKGGHDAETQKQTQQTTKGR